MMPAVPRGRGKEAEKGKERNERNKHVQHKERNTLTIPVINNLNYYEYIDKK